MRNPLKLKKKTSRVLAERSRVVRAAIEPMEPRVLLSSPASVALSATPTSITEIYSTSVNGLNHTVVDTGSNEDGVGGATGNGKSINLEYQLYEYDAGENNIFPTPGTLNSISSLNFQVDDDGEATTGNYAAVAGGFNVYFVPNTLSQTTDNTLKFNSDVTGLVGQAGVSSADLLGTINFSSPPTTAGNTKNTYLAFTYNSAFSSSADYATFLGDLNNNTSFRIAVTPNTATTAADALVGNYDGIQAPTLTINDTSGSATAAESFSLSSPTYSVNENADTGNAVISVNRSGYLGDAASVNYATSDGTALAGTNYTATSGTLNFAVGQSVAYFTVPITNVGNMGGNKAFNVTLSTPVNTAGNASLGTQTTATETIIDTTPVPRNSILSSAAGSTNDEEPSGTYSTSYAPVVGNMYAEAGSGYPGNISTTIGFNSFSFDGMEFIQYSPTTTPNIYPTTDGQTFNSLSSLTLGLDNSTTSGTYAGQPGNFDVFFVPNAATSTSVKFQFADPTGLNGQLSITSADLLGTFSFDNNTGTDEFTPASIPSGVSSALLADLNGTGANYGLPGKGSAFELVVTPETSGVGAIAADLYGDGNVNLAISGPTTQNYQIESVALSSSTYTVNETAGTATITLNRSSSTSYNGDQATVQYATSDGTALAGTNYTAESGTATFQPGSNSTSFTVPITDVVNQGGNKVLNITLSNPAVNDPTNALISLGSPSSATLTIVDSNNNSNNTEDLGPGTGAGYTGDTSTVQEPGPYSTYYLRPNGLKSTASPYPGYGAMTFNEPSNPYSYTSILGGQVVTALNSLTLDVFPESSSYGSTGQLDIYLVQDGTSNIDPAATEIINPHYFDKNVITGTYAGSGLDTTGAIGVTNNFGTPMLLGTVTWTSAEQTGNAEVQLLLANYNASTEATLISDLNTGAIFRLIATPTSATSTVSANWVGTGDTGASATEVPALDMNVTYAAPSTTPSVVLSAAGGQSSTTDPTDPLSFTATVSGGVPDGEIVNLLNTSDNQIVATGTTSAGVASFSVTPFTMPSGSDVLEAVYAGDANFLFSDSNTLTQTVTALPTASTLSAPVTQPTSTLTSKALNFTATITTPNSNPLPANEVVSLVDTSNSNKVIATGSATGGNGTETVTFSVSASTLALGTHVLEVQYAGDIFYASNTSSNTLTQTIVSTATTNTLAAQSGQATTSDAVTPLTFTATLSPSVPDGETVDLYDTTNGSNTLVGFGTTSGGVATINLAANALVGIGPHVLEAVYYGDSTNAGSTATFTQTITADLGTLNSTLDDVQRSSISTITIQFNSAVTLGNGTNTSVFTLYQEVLNANGTLSGTQNNVTSGVQEVLSNGGKTLTLSVISGGSLDRTNGTASNGDPGYFANGVYQLVLNGAAITYNNTGATYNSGAATIVSFTNSVSGDNGYSQYFGVLFGDLHGTGSVNTVDERAFILDFGSSVGDPHYNVAFDYNGTGSVNTISERKFVLDFGVSYIY